MRAAALQRAESLFPSIEVKEAERLVDVFAHLLGYPSPVDKLDPNNATAANNLAVIKIKSGQAAEAIVLWRRALTANPAQTGARMNLAQALFRQGNKAAAAIEVQQALIYDPDQPAARRLLNQLRLQP